MLRCRVEAEATYAEIAELFELSDPRTPSFAIQQFVDPEAYSRRLERQRQRDTLARSKTGRS